MGEIAARLADQAVVTSDNPRTEDPQKIVDQVAAGAFDGNPVRKIVDRREAIAQVLAGADANDVVLIAGKGHEDYQEAMGVRHPFSDMEEARAGLAKRGLAA
jgi:UDP-N-acetylmuramoyl-L-alanyl-D-glutamate--2,6-diaminopimelate ligase